MKELIAKIEQWAEDRNLIKGSTPQKQMLKLMEEFGELCSGIAKNKQEVIKDSLGDCTVVMIILKKQLGIGGYEFDKLEEKFEMPETSTIANCCLDFAIHYGSLARHIGMVDRFGLGIYPANIVFDLIRCYGSILAIAKTEKIKIKECLEFAYEQIKDRKGKMVDGVFVKEEDLQDVQK